jgi:hypothetical protein
MYNFAIPTHNGVKQGDALSSLLFSYSLTHEISKIQENKVETECDRKKHKYCQNERGMSIRAIET